MAKKDGNFINQGGIKSAIAPKSIDWKAFDQMYSYNEDDLGATYISGSVTLKLWAPLADAVTVFFYDKDDDTKLIGQFPLVREDRGVWVARLQPSQLDTDDLCGYFYQYEVTNEGIARKVLDPYAKSMAPSRVDTKGDVGSDGDKIGKAAIVNLSNTAPDKYDFAHIEGYYKREDAIIWEIHVRDFTSDPSIEGELSARWGTYKAFENKLDYIRSLGVTHVQLLPVMAWYFGDETRMGERELHYSSIDNEYNWGYDPHNYFSPDGAYSENAADPLLRIKELKSLIHAIHQAGMGVILDVVYTHMALVNFLNDIVPGYYAWQDADGEFIGGFGNNLATDRTMAEKLMVDSVKYWFSEYKIDGLRWDMMGDATYPAVQKAFDEAARIHPKPLFIGEGWRTFAGDKHDESLRGLAADQDWMDKTDNVGVFSDEIRNELKSGFGSEGEPRFLTGGARDVNLIFQNIKAQPSNIPADSPGDVVQYIEAHDNLTLYDVIAISIHKDPTIAENDVEIHERIRIGNVLLLTSQGTVFLHGGQEYGRTKQWEGAKQPEHKFHELTNRKGELLGYFIDDSYDSTDAINHFDWAKATVSTSFPVNNITREHMQGLIQLRKSSDAFRLGNQALVDQNVTLISSPDIKEKDLVIAYTCASSDLTQYYHVFINADERSRSLRLTQDYSGFDVIVDQTRSGIQTLINPKGMHLNENEITLEPLTAIVLRECKKNKL
ncbi:alpha-amylase family glycosyl hydrolase [Paenibacillus sp. Marseille-Q4541]|uniref:alpha-amylase family glycosyl hydrolase n=1 Tax=Paenibacillus sp. Marseille-Q4541 TaxID=2831522 RepID=UPI001BAA3BE5|nr:alpha-amylase family glycosyl hydrolase [Paenibacillus sp. Marseille-Q4541]